MNKTFDELGFKVGDFVKCVDHNHHIYTVGEVYALSKYELTDALVILDRYNGKMGNWELVKSAKEDKQMSKWTSTKTEVVTKEVKTINKVIDGRLSNCGGISIAPVSTYTVEIVVGASFRDKSACWFNKDSLQELIDVLTEVHDAMEGK